jgi:hypothetical protein
MTLVGSLSAPNTFGFKNRIINGNMVIDQRNAGAAVTLSVEKYAVDRFSSRAMTSTNSTAQQSSTAPAGFSKSLLYTVGTGATAASTDRNYSIQAIEGNNVSDLGWGTANAQTVTLSFWVRSSVTGTFGGALQNSAQTRSYPYTYTINAANTFEYKSITIAGDTSGTWLTDNGAGVYMFFDMGSGATYLGTAGAWAGGDYRGAIGDTKLVATTGATFYITGVQVERGSVATSFDFRSYSTELALCQRYYEKSFNIETAPANGTSTATATAVGVSVFVATNRISGLGTNATFKVTKRATPVITTYGNSSGYWGYMLASDTALSWSSVVQPQYIGATGFTSNQQVVDGTLVFIIGHWVASAEL